MRLHEDDSAPLTWKRYLLAWAQFLFIFYFATLGLGYFFLHHAEYAKIWAIAMGVSYLVIIVLSGIRMIKKLSMAAIMITAPTIPLFMLIIVVSMLPILQMVEKREHLTQPVPVVEQRA